MQQSQAEHGHCFWIMEDKAEGAIIGFCGPRRGRHLGTPIHGALELGWRLASSHWGKGYAKEAARRGGAAMLIMGENPSTGHQ